MATEIEDAKTVIKLHPCIRCGSSDITLKVFEDGYIHPAQGGGTCGGCGYKVSGTIKDDDDSPESVWGPQCAEVWNEHCDIGLLCRDLQRQINRAKRELAQLKKIKSDRALGITVGTQSVI